MSESHSASLQALQAASTLETPEGAIKIYSHFPPELFSELRLDDGLGNFTNYSSIIQKLDAFERVASGRDGRVGLALQHDKVIVGYLTCGYPDPDDRWSKLGDLMYELAAIEVSRNFRGIHLSSALMRAVMHHDWFEDKIVYMNGYSWHWDLDGNALTTAQYRVLMVNLMTKHGLSECYTNEPNIAIREENLFMVRIGSRVSPEDRQRFRNLRFGIMSRL